MRRAGSGGTPHGEEVPSGARADPLAAATRSATTVSTGVLAGLGSTSLTRAVVVEPNDEWLSVVVEGAAAPVTVELVDPLGGLVAQGASLVSGSSAAGLDIDPGERPVSTMSQPAELAALGETGLM